jgi:hypothetical protein
VIALPSSVRREVGACALAWKSIGEVILTGVCCCLLHWSLLAACTCEQSREGEKESVWSTWWRVKSMRAWSVAACDM